MAIGRLSVGVGPKGKAGPHAMYIAREGKYAKHNDKIEKLEATGSGNMPDWAQADPNFFWKMSDEHERKNGTSYREHVIALPRELTAEQRHELIKEWIEQEIGEKHAYQYAIHNPLAMDGGEQPHAHIMFSERLIDGIDRDPDQYFKRHNSKNPEKGGAKKANTPKLADERKLELKDQRDRWEKLCNSHLELAGSDARISMKSLADQGIDRDPVNLSMQQIKRADVEEIYTDLLTATAKFNNAKLDGQAINIVAELSAINEKYEKYHEQADRTINTASDAINYSQSIIEDRERRIIWSSKKHQRYEQRIESSTKRISISEQLVTNTKQRVNDSKQLITSTSEQLDQIIRELEEQRLAAERKQQERIAAEKAAQERLAAEKAAQERLAAEKAAQERLAAEKAAQERLAADRAAIGKRPPFELVNIRMESTVINKYSRRKDNELSGNVPIGEMINHLLQAMRDGHEVVLDEGDNSHLANNKTAQSIKEFMLKNLSDKQVRYDYGDLGIEKFTDKYALRCDISDLKRLNDINPPEPMHEPQKQPQRQSQPVKSTLRNDDYDLGM
ncbi:MobA/MobL family protein [Psychrobacter communis]|uniref:MobA/MobL family protein n=1 Tax=Psychrobacter communis TaxID=2762238 RepID=UPI001CD8CA6E|nr:MobA/MobL family protein [Psychrobacter communis]